MTEQRQVRPGDSPSSVVSAFDSVKSIVMNFTYIVFFIAIAIVMYSVLTEVFSGSFIIEPI
jgi:hypothetical protein